LHTELAVTKTGVDTDQEPEDAFTESEDEGPSLRTRLTRAVESRRATGSDDDSHQWR
jgi:hypothetical protein